MMKKRPELFEIYFAPASVWRLGAERPHEWRWRVKSSNGKIIGGSTEGYNRIGMAVKNLAFVTGVEARFPTTQPTKQDRWFAYEHIRAARHRGITMDAAN
jgi:uncharacterized protein YegP (UPF0339 family)